MTNNETHEFSKPPFSSNAVKSRKQNLSIYKHLPMARTQEIFIICYIKVSRNIEILKFQVPTWNLIWCLFEIQLSGMSKSITIREKKSSNMVFKAIKNWLKLIQSQQNAATSASGVDTLVAVSRASCRRH